jgi:hypothetical protein
MGSKLLGIKSAFSLALKIFGGARIKPPIPSDDRNQSLRVCISLIFN